MHHAVEKGRYKCVESLLALQADPNYKDKYNTTPLHLAVQCYKQNCGETVGGELLLTDVRQIVRELLINGADP